MTFTPALSTTLANISCMMRLSASSEKLRAILQPASGDVPEEDDASGSPNVEYVYLDGRPIATFTTSTGD